MRVFLPFSCNVSGSIAFIGYKCAQGVKYNIPVLVWFPERFPSVPPLVYVTPTANMVIKPQHRHVNPSGLVSTPCLLQWAPGSEALLAIAEMAMLFGTDPPLYSRPTLADSVPVPPTPTPLRPQPQPALRPQPAPPGPTTNPVHVGPANNVRPGASRAAEILLAGMQWPGDGARLHCLCFRAGHGSRQ